MNDKKTWRHVTACAIALVVSNSTSANSILNGSFETPTVTSINQYQTILLGSEPAGFGWKIISGNVDAVISGTFFASSAIDGLQFLDLDGTVPGGIAQSIVTIPGDTYVLNFAYANNPNGTTGATVPAGATARVTDTQSSNDLVSTLLLIHGSSTAIAPDWATSGPIMFVAIGSNTTVSFTSDDTSGSGGIFLDAVSLNSVVPLPATFGLFGLGLGGIGLLRRCAT